MMCAWKKNEHIEFDFHDAHDLNVALDTSQPDTIRRRLRERLANTKQVVLLVGDVTRAVAGRPARFLHYEVEVIERLGLPVVFTNLDNSRRVRASRLPVRLESQYTISVPFRAKAIRHALDDFVGRYPKERHNKVTPHFYKDHVYQQLGL